MQVAFQVLGAVQGVGYRRFVVREARALGLAGWVQNEPDGSVRGEAEGPEPQLAAFRIRLAEGPPFAVVNRLDWKDLGMRSSLPHSFEIRR
jgi:acylphosphatase